MPTITKFIGAAAALSLLFGAASIASAATAKSPLVIPVVKSTAAVHASTASPASTKSASLSSATVVKNTPVTATTLGDAVVSNATNASAAAVTDQEASANIPNTPAALGDSPAMKINADGSIAVDGAQIINIAGDTITATVTWGQINETWTVDTNSSTVFRRRYNGLSDLGEISVGDVISFTGTLIDMDGNNLTTMADHVKDWSIQHKDSSFTGTVESLSTGNQSFDMSTAEGFTLDVFTFASTTITIGGATSTYADIQVGDHVSRTNGIWNSDLNTLQAYRVHINGDD